MPMKVEWLNDSSCNVILVDENYATKALNELSLSIQDSNLSKDWKKGIPYKEKDIEFSLYFRIATNKVMYLYM